MSEYTAARQLAETEKKDLLVVFTGTYWIELCEDFYEEILSRPEFLEPVQETFVLVKLEFPPSSGRGEENPEPPVRDLLKESYGVQGFPTVVLTWADGKPYGLNGFQPVTPEEYAEQLLTMSFVNREKAEARAAAEDLQGMEKAEALVEGVPDLPGEMLVRHYLKEMQTVMEEDPENSLGRTIPYRNVIAEVDYYRAMEVLAEDVQWGRMIELTESYLRDYRPEGEALQRVLLEMAEVEEKRANLAGKVRALLRIVEEDADSEYGMEAQRRLDILRAEKLQNELSPQ